MRELLIPALRQYLHNDGSRLVFAYDREYTEAIVNKLQIELAGKEEVIKTLHDDIAYYRNVTVAR